MMKVYVVTEDVPYEGSTVEAVYLCREKAEEHAARLDKNGMGMAGGNVHEFEVIE